MRYAEVYLHRHMVPDGGLAGHTAVVFDVLRASTSVCAALESGAESVVPFDDLERIKNFRSELPNAVAGDFLLAGERGGLAAPGFDIGNSPGEFTSEAVSGKHILFSTTNGTDALSRAGEADPLFFGALVNVSALAEEIDRNTRRGNEELALVCSGTELSVSLEDMLAAGIVLEKLLGTGEQWEIDDGAHAVLAVARNWAGREREAMELAVGGRNVSALGFTQDIDYAAKIDSTRVVPMLVPGSGILEGVDTLIDAGNRK